MREKFANVVAVNAETARKRERLVVAVHGCKQTSKVATETGTKVKYTPLAECQGAGTEWEEHIW